MGRNLIYKSLIGVFVLVLLIPNTGFLRRDENAKIIARENRKITVFPKDSMLAKGFYNNFENWYRDRLRGRAKAIRYWRESNFACGVVLSDDIFVGKNGWLFRRSRLIGSFLNKQEKADTLKRLQNYCEQYGANFVFLSPTVKEYVYADCFPDRMVGKNKEYSYWENQLADVLKAKGVNYLSVTNELMSAKESSKAPLYFLDDHHWSYEGAAIGSEYLLKKFAELDHNKWYYWQKLDMYKNDVFKECSYSNELSFRQTYRTEAPWSSSFVDDIYVVDCYTGKEEKLKEIPSNNILLGRIVNGEAIVKNKSLHNGRTLLIMGDSFSSYMVPYLSQYYETVISTHYRDIAGKKKEVDLRRLLTQYKPNDVLLENVVYQFYHSNDKNQIGRIMLK